MELVPVTMEVPKESKEVVDAVVKIADHILQKKPLAEIADLIPPALKAVDGFDQVDDEFKTNSRDELVGYFVQQVMALFPIKEDAAE